MGYWIELDEAPKVWETGPTRNGDLRYIIQVRCVMGIWQQRHIWLETPYLTPGVVEVGKWIRSIQSRPRDPRWRLVEDDEACLAGMNQSIRRMK